MNSDLKKIEQVVKRTVVEVYKKKDKSCNVMFFGFEDANCNIEAEVKDLLKCISNGDEKNLVKIERVGEKELSIGLNHQKMCDSRPVKATFQDPSSVNRVVRAAHELASISQFKNIYISRDLTREERTKRQILVKKLKNAIEKTPSRYWKIKGEEIIDMGEKFTEMQWT